MTARTAAILTKEGRRRQGTGQGNNEVEREDGRGAQDRRLDTANMSAKVPAHWNSKKDTAYALELPV